MNPKTITIIISIIAVIIVVVIISSKKEKFTMATSLPAKCSTASVSPSSGCPSFSGHDNNLTTVNSATPAPMILTVNNLGNIETSPSLPTGSVVMWVGNTSPPTGWAFCDGASITLPDGSQFNTPDLRSRFVIGSSASNNTVTATESKLSGSSNISNYKVGDYGGEEVHLLVQAEMPSHNHTVNTYVSGSGMAGVMGNSVYPASQTLAYTLPAGQDSPHNNLPPFYTLSYIIKYM